MDSTLPVPCSKNAGLSGELFYAHKNEPGTLYEKDIDEGVLIATVPLESDGWSEFPQNRLMVYRSGEPVYAGDRSWSTAAESLSMQETGTAIHIFITRKR